MASLQANTKNVPGMLSFKRFGFSFFPCGDQIHRDAFGMKRMETLVPYPDSSVNIGQRDGMSDIDILRVNKLYKCHGY